MLLGAACALASVATSSAAHAENDDGLELMVRPAIGSAGSGSPVVYAPDSGARLGGDPGKIWSGTASPYGAGFIGDAWLGYRFSRFASAGISAGTRSASTSAVDDGSTNLARSAWTIGPYVRGYAPTFLGFEPWLAIGAQYVHDTQSFDRPVMQGLTSYPTTWTLTHHGVAVPIGIGVDYRFLELFGVGPSFMYSPVIPVAGCAKPEVHVTGASSNNFCSNDSSPKLTAANGYGVWSVGLDVRVTLF
jgi:hypothetical protein